MKKMSKCLVLVVLIVWLFPMLCLASTPPDIIHEYTVVITPQSDGTMVMKYDFDYEATTDFPNGKAYLEIGVPNRNFEIVDYEPKSFISGTEAITSSKSQVHLDFHRLPLKGDRFKFSFTIRQKSMVYKDEDKYSIQFIPGWFDFAEIKNLWVKLNIEGIKILTVDPEPYQKSESQLIFLTTELETNQKPNKITITVGLDSFSISDEDLAKDESSSAFLTTALIVVVVLTVIVVVITIISVDGGSDYSGGSYIGGWSGGSSSHSSGSGLSSGSRLSSGSSSGRSTGGSGGFSGRGSSCACVSSCACACACAGGGRAGCSEKGYRILRLIIRKKTEGK